MRFFKKRIEEKNETFSPRGECRKDCEMKEKAEELIAGNETEEIYKRERDT
jgi:hypothetical protein